MQNNFKISMVAFSVLVGVSNAQAGQMGPISVATDVPFISGEGSYTWKHITTPAGGNVVTTVEPWGGRVGAGIKHRWRENWGVTAEAGYGYYGYNHSTINQSGGNDLLNFHSS